MSDIVGTITSENIVLTLRSDGTWEGPKEMDDLMKWLSEQLPFDDFTGPDSGAFGHYVLFESADLLNKRDSRKSKWKSFYKLPIDHVPNRVY